MFVVRNDFVYQVIIFAIPLIGLYWSQKDRAAKHERRITVLEKDIENIRELKKIINKKEN